MLGFLVGVMFVGQVGTWQDANSQFVRYEIANKSGQEIDLASLKARVVACVSNTSIPENGVPHDYTVDLDTLKNGTVKATVFDRSTLHKDKCFEEVTMKVDPPGKVPDGGTFTVTFQFTHKHFMYNYDPLLGRRSVIIECGSLRFSNTTSTNKVRPYHPPLVDYTPPEAKVEKLFPDSIHLFCHSGENEDKKIKFNKQSVRHSTKYRLSFDYLLLKGSERELKVEVCQAVDGNDYTSYGKEAVKDLLSDQGRWVKYHKVFTTEPTASFVYLEIGFPVYGSNPDVGEAYIRNVKLVPVEDFPQEP